MKKIKNIKNNGIRLAVFTGTLLALTTIGCNKFMEIPLPTNQTAADGAFLTNASTGSVLSGIYYSMVNSSYPAGSSGIAFNSGLYTDELTNLNPASSTNAAFYTDNINSANTGGMWASFYQQINTCNVAIEGINNATALLSNKNQYLGEAYATRAFLYFNMVNIYGGIPLAITSDYKVNNALPRASADDVYAQIIADAKMAVSLLPADFRDANGLTVTLRVRPTRYAASALLARAYLYTGKWAEAEAAATDIINNSTLFKLMPPAQTFTAAGNTELIWGLLPTGANYVADYSAYNAGMPATIPVGGSSPKTIISYGAAACLSDALLANFEANDTRYANWVRATFDQNTNKTYYYPNKYKSNVNGVEDIVLIRLAEIYLIRAEARAQLSNVSGSQADINVIRTRAGLPNTTAATQATLLTAVEKERRTELFTEFGHRFYDLKRTAKIDALMNTLAPQKGGTWATFKQLWPISASDVVINPNLVQNPGYK
ncbi:RagB/SusD family nutrient uptake outer membrane protein [Mucilaginibacter mali]|uniref:RagB/SusD family nutrient uptake outer membrane protein n=1 Tax=Mucilaginibacter mali TaxID=2740462 RepID=A0A7D4Q1Q8_9SPHI|nr:RagB/SusD family nutrient uptake outer membrane protein [Mucilaginibacter mali]QKJ30666.1 RagB/SusD family nutrient uptake outer membrane protein [Mucilaginibacter mali]